MKDILNDTQDYIYNYSHKNITVKIFMDTPFDGMCTYISQTPSTNNKTHKELLMLFEEGVDMNLYSVIFGVVVEYFQENADAKYYGGHTMPLGPVISGSSVTAFCLSPAYAFDDENIWDKYFWVVPITDKELSFLHENGLSALEDHIEHNSINVTNLMRKDSL
jgi:hypothetical protein